MENKVTEKMKANIENHKEYFNSRIDDGHIITYLNGFVGCGVFSKPQDHITKGTNVLWIYQVGFNLKGNRIIELQNVEITLDEAEDLHKCLGIVIKRYKKINGGR